MKLCEDLKCLVHLELGGVVLDFGVPG